MPDLAHDHLTPAVDESWQRAIRVGLGVWLATRVGFLALARVVTAIAPAPLGGPPVHSSWYAWPFRIYAHYDAGHFLRIAQYGYLSRGVGDGNVAFFPAYPLASRYLADAIGLGRPSLLDYQVMLALVAAAGTAVATVLLYKMICDCAGPLVALVSVLTLLIGPYSLFLMAPYSEGPFLAFAIGAWICARGERWGWAGVLCAVATLIRVNGIFLFAGILVMYLLARRTAATRHKALDGLLLLPIASVLVYFGWLKIATGNWGAWFSAERRGWDRHTTWPWLTLRRSIEFLRNADHPAQQLQSSMELLFAALFLAAVILLARRRQWPEFTYVGLTALSLMTSTFYQSVPRSSLLAFPVIPFVARWLLQYRARLVIWAVLGASAVLLLTNVAFFVRGYSAG